MTDLIQSYTLAVLATTAVLQTWWLARLTKRVHCEREVNDERWKRRHEP